MSEEPQVTTISEKGQIIIPQSIRKELGIKPRTKFLVFGKGDTVIMKKLELPDMKKKGNEILNHRQEKPKTIRKRNPKRSNKNQKTHSSHFLRIRYNLREHAEGCNKCLP
jgi:AbrB family looped-hinge helix DNA binding protein